jgi:hypothetical protein
MPRGVRIPEQVIEPVKQLAVRPGATASNVANANLIERFMFVSFATARNVMARLDLFHLTTLFSVTGKNKVRVDGNI